MSKDGTGILRWVRLFFGIFMIVVYLGMAYLLIINFFNWGDSPVWLAVRYVFAAILAAYGLYRCYRQVKGIDYYRLDNFKDTTDSPYGRYNNKESES